MQARSLPLRPYFKVLETMKRKKSVLYLINPVGGEKNKEIPTSHQNTFMEINNLEV